MVHTAAQVASNFGSASPYQKMLLKFVRRWSLNAVPTLKLWQCKLKFWQCRPALTAATEVPKCQLLNIQTLVVLTSEAAVRTGRANICITFYTPEILLFANSCNSKQSKIDLFIFWFMLFVDLFVCFKVFFKACFKYTYLESEIVETTFVVSRLSDIRHGYNFVPSCIQKKQPETMLV